MAKKVTQDEIVQMNELKREGKSYAEIGRILGRSGATVSKYIVGGAATTSTTFEGEIPPVEKVILDGNNAYWLLLTEDEVKEIEKLRGELLL